LRGPAVMGIEFWSMQMKFYISNVNSYVKVLNMLILFLHVVYKFP
jgi:hypothetical protein